MNIKRFSIANLKTRANVIAKTITSDADFAKNRTELELAKKHRTKRQAWETRLQLKGTFVITFNNNKPVTIKTNFKAKANVNFF